MRTILYSATPSNLSHFCDAISIKTGYILADESCIAGSPAHNIEFSHAMMQMSSIKYRLQFLQNKQDCDEEQRTAISQATEMLKSLTQVKHKNKAMLVMQRKLENIINDIFVSYLDEIQDKFTEAGFNGISELLKDEKTIIGYHHMHLVDPETSDTFFTKASLLLTRMGSSYEDEMEIYFLPFEFFLSEFAEDIPTSDNASGSQTPYLEKWMTMPAVSSLSATELRAVRNQLSQPATPFRAAINEWVLHSIDNQDSAARLDFFKSTVLPAALQFDHDVNNNEIISTLRSKLHPSANIEIFLGEIPITTLWSFFKWANVIKDETWQLLEAAKEGNEKYSKRIPVIALKSQIMAAEETLEEDFFAQKKSISIDD